VILKTMLWQRKRSGMEAWHDYQCIRDIASDLELAQTIQGSLNQSYNTGIVHYSRLSTILQSHPFNCTVS
jgi:hypothetical protein